MRLAVFTGNRHFPLCQELFQTFVRHGDEVIYFEKSEQLADADVALVTSCFADGVSASVSYLPPEGLREFDRVVSPAEGPVLEELRAALGVRAVTAFRDWIDPLASAA